MEHHEPPSKAWSSVKIYGIVGICLISVIGIAYLAGASFRTSASRPRVVEPVIAQESGMKTMPNSSRIEADNQAEALLARLREKPDDPLLLADIGKMYFQMRRFSMAAKYYDDSVRLKPDASVLVKLGGAYHYAGSDEKAIGAWNRALHLDPNNPDALFNIGFVKWHSQGDTKAAIDAWQRLLETNPTHPKRAQVEALIAQARRHLGNNLAVKN